MRRWTVHRGSRTFLFKPGMQIPLPLWLLPRREAEAPLASLRPQTADQTTKQDFVSFKRTEQAAQSYSKLSAREATTRRERNTSQLTGPGTNLWFTLMSYYLGGYGVLGGVNGLAYVGGVDGTRARCILFLSDTTEGGASHGLAGHLVEIWPMFELSDRRIDSLLAYICN